MLTKYPPTRELAFPDGTTATIRRATPRIAAVAITDLIAAVGPVFAGVIGGGGIRVSDDKVIPLGALLPPEPPAQGAPAEAHERHAVARQVHAQALGDIVAALLRSASHLDGARLLQIAEQLIVGHTVITPVGGNGRGVELAQPVLLDTLLPDAWAVFGLARAAIELNVGPIFAAAGGARGPAAAPQS